MTVALAAAAAVLFGAGTYLLLQRQLSRIVIGLSLLAHGANLLLLQSSGGEGEPSFIGGGDPDDFLDPLPQAFVLTAIVISFGVMVFLLALAYRSFELTRDDEVQDDLEDRYIASRQRSKPEEVRDLEESADAGDEDAEAGAGTGDESAEVES